MNLPDLFDVKRPETTTPAPYVPAVINPCDCDPTAQLSESRRQGTYDALPEDDRALIHSLFERMVAIEHSTLALRDTLQSALPSYVHDSVTIYAGSTSAQVIETSANDVRYTSLVWSNPSGSALTLAIEDRELDLGTTVLGSLHDLGYIVGGSKRPRIKATLAAANAGDAVSVDLFGQIIPLAGRVR